MKKKQLYTFEEVLIILKKEKGRSFRGLEWHKQHKCIRIEYIKNVDGDNQQPFIALIWDNGGEIIHPYIPSSYDMLGEIFMEVKEL